ncbi:MULTISPECIES: hypothetical protein [unclassified Mesorhizobium]|uniref:hypothetical protein n=1 Tax=unclassified Mesorhizobium TaxID=325217 RepID=UPI002416A3FF|nr:MULTISPECIES: hypothetical protein [unclassified Mesorhizobium]MDG4903500.1 hypothetical protein [Mesorhizobium sp. WSM4962]MDG4921450.1 hypothetical protein [Mesorhizobium sp. WSM4989]
MPGPWEKYQQTPAVPPGFRVISQPPSQPRFPGVPVQTSNVFDQFDTPAAAAGGDPWAAFPDAPAQKVPPSSPATAAAADPWAAFPDAQPSGAAAKGDRLPQSGPWEKYSPVRSKLPELEDALRNADAAGDTAAARMLADEIVRQRGAIPGTGDAGPALLEINGHLVEVDGSFRAMPREQQQTTVDEIAKSLPTDGPWTKYGSSASSPNVTQVKAPDGSIVEFPAGTSDDDMAKAMQETFGGPAGSAPTQKPSASQVGNALRQSLGLPPEPVEQPPISTAKDVGESFASGVPRGVVETAMFPITLSRMVEGAGNYLYNGTENLVRRAIGADPLSEQELARRAEMANSSPAYGLQDRTREIMDAVLHKPQTTAGEYANTIGEFAAPGGLPSKGARMAETGFDVARRYGADAMGNVIAPAVASETAGQATEGTPYEGMMRFLGALFGNAGTAAVRVHNAPESVIRRATGDLTDEQWQRARDLQNNSVGVGLTGPEAISQATGGASALPSVQRVVEGSTTGGARMGPFFAQRVAQVGSAVGDVLDQVALQSPQPSTLGPRAAEVAGNVLDQTSQSINAQTRPLYQAAEPQTLPQAQFAPIAADPRFQAGLARLRGNAELAPDYAHLPDNSIGVIDAVTKDLNARGEALANAANPLYGPELAGRSRAAAADARNTATNASPDYAQALGEQEALRRAVLNPLEQGPVGRVAAATDTTGAGNALLPHDPLTGSAGEAAEATRRLAAEDPATTSALVRQNLADRFTKASTETQEGVQDYAGAKFRKDVAGNATRQEVLDAVLRSLPGGEATADRMNELLDVLQATGRRKPIGSATEFNRTLNADLGDAPPAARAIAVATSLGRSLFTNAGDAVRRKAMRDGVSTLADMFIAPNSVELIRNARNRTGGAIVSDAAARTALESGVTLRER